MRVSALSSHCCHWCFSPELNMSGLQEITFIIGLIWLAKVAINGPNLKKLTHKKSNWRKWWRKKNKILAQTLNDKTNKLTVHPAKTQISLGIHPVWSESLLCTQWVAKDPSFLHVDSKDPDQTGRMPRLIWVFYGCTVILSWGGSYYHDRIFVFNEISR